MRAVVRRSAPDDPGRRRRLPTESSLVGGLLGMGLVALATLGLLLAAGLIALVVSLLF